MLNFLQESDEQWIFEESNELKQHKATEILMLQTCSFFQFGGPCPFGAKPQSGTKAEPFEAGSLCAGSEGQWQVQAGPVSTAVTLPCQLHTEHTRNGSPKHMSLEMHCILNFLFELRDVEKSKQHHSVEQKKTHSRTKWNLSPETRPVSNRKALNQRAVDSGGNFLVPSEWFLEV